MGICQAIPTKFTKSKTLTRTKTRLSTSSVVKAQSNHNSLYSKTTIGATTNFTTTHNKSLTKEDITQLEKTPNPESNEIVSNDNKTRKNKEPYNKHKSKKWKTKNSIPKSNASGNRRNGVLKNDNDYNPKEKKVKESELLVAPSLVVNHNINNPKDEYTFLKKMGEGSYGTVWKVRNNKTGLIRAMKRIPKVKNDTSNTEILNEIEALKRLDHANIVKIFEYFVEPDGYYLITEFWEGGELFDVIKKEKRLSEPVAANIIYQIYSAVHYCHTTSHLIHRDLKPENILVESIDPLTGFINVKIIDFGTSTLFDKSKKEKKVIGSTYYIAPEVLNKDYNEKCDIWSCGVIWYILLSGRIPFNGHTNDQIIQRIKSCKYDWIQEPFNKISNEAKDLIKSCWELNVSKRHSAEKCLSHKWFEKNRTKKYFFEVPDHFFNSTINNIINYSPKNKLQEITLTYLVHNFPNWEDIKSMNKMFKWFNTTNNGKLTKEEMKKGLKQGWLANTNKKNLSKEVDKIFQNIDSDNNGFIECEEFSRAGLDKKIFQDDNVLKFIFDFLDKDGSGEISLEELKQNFNVMNNKTAEICLLNILQDIDEDGNGEISFKEYKSMMLKIIFD